MSENKKENNTVNNGCFIGINCLYFLNSMGMVLPYSYLAGHEIPCIHD